jgi:hypothetical protein
MFEERVERQVALLRHLQLGGNAENPLEIIHFSMGLKLLNSQLSSVQKPWVVDDYNNIRVVQKPIYWGYHPFLDLFTLWL